MACKDQVATWPPHSKIASYTPVLWEEMKLTVYDCDTKSYNRNINVQRVNAVAVLGYLGPGDLLHNH